jgi:pimeloyl-ACP methyl ester carboxylesterase
MPFITAGGRRLEYEWAGDASPAPASPVVVMLHEGLGSVARWRDFPAAGAEAVKLPVLVYSRWGYGKSEPIPHGPRPPDYQNPEGRAALPELLTKLGIARPIL